MLHQPCNELPLQSTQPTKQGVQAVTVVVRTQVFLWMLASYLLRSLVTVSCSHSIVLSYLLLTSSYSPGLNRFYSQIFHLCHEVTMSFKNQKICLSSQVIFRFLFKAVGLYLLQTASLSSSWEQIVKQVTIQVPPVTMSFQNNRIGQCTKSSYNLEIIKMRFLTKFLEPLNSDSATFYYSEGQQPEFQPSRMLFLFPSLHASNSLSPKSPFWASGRKERHVSFRDQLLLPPQVWLMQGSTSKPKAEIEKKEVYERTRQVGQKHPAVFRCYHRPPGCLLNKDLLLLPVIS